ncbi:MAG: preprotein translocase subunit YajC [Actinomycetota bacterium]
MIEFLTLVAQEKQSQGGGLTMFLPLVLMGVFFYFVFIRPQQRRTRSQREMLSELSVGDEVLTVGGILGTIDRLDDDEVTVEIAPGTSIRVVRSAIARRLVEEDEPEDEEEAGRTP